MKTIRLNSVVFEMLLVIAKKQRLKPEECISALIEQAYGARK